MIKEIRKIAKENKLFYMELLLDEIETYADLNDYITQERLYNSLHSYLWALHDTGIINKETRKKNKRFFN